MAACLLPRGLATARGRARTEGKRKLQGKGKAAGDETGAASDTLGCKGPPPPGAAGVQAPGDGPRRREGVPGARVWGRVHCARSESGATAARGAVGQQRHGRLRRPYTTTHVALAPPFSALRPLSPAPFSAGTRARSGGCASLGGGAQRAAAAVARGRRKERRQPRRTPRKKKNVFLAPALSLPRRSFTWRARCAYGCAPQLYSALRIARVGHREARRGAGKAWKTAGKDGEEKKGRFTFFLSLSLFIALLSPSVFSLSLWHRVEGMPVAEQGALPWCCRGTALAPLRVGHWRQKGRKGARGESERQCAELVPSLPAPAAKARRSEHGRKHCC